MKTTKIKITSYFSKRKFKDSLLCNRRAWLIEHRKDLINHTTSAIAEEGIEFERVARELLAPGGIEIPFDAKKFEPAAKRTKQLLLRPQAVIYQAVFLTGTGELSIADVVVKDATGIHIFEFKSSPVNQLHVYDGAFQLLCGENSGNKIKSLNVVFPNRDYMKNGTLTSDLYIVRNITDVARRVVSYLPSKISAHKKNLTRSEEPDDDIGEKCFKPYPCPLKDHCFGGLGTNNVFDVRGMKLNTKLHLYYKGITDMAAIREKAGKMPGEKSMIQINSVLSNSIVIQREELRKWCEPLRDSKLYFFDVETIAPLVPVLNGTFSKTVTVTQYSLHTQLPDGTLIHSEYLADPTVQTDFRKELLIKLLLDLEATNGAGAILTWNKVYEIGCLKRLAKLYPEFSAEIKKVVSRIVDLMSPFKDMLYVDPRFQGSYSIKAVLPVLCPDLSYKALKINNGADASTQFLKLYTASANERKVISENLRRYCELDTFAMKRILDFLFTI